MARAPRPAGPQPPTFSNAPSTEALAFWRNKTAVPSFDWRDVWAEEYAYSFTVAKAMQLDVLEALRRSVDTALANGVPFEQFAAELTPRLQRMGWWGTQFVVDPETGEEVLATLGTPQRLRLIYDANIRSAHAAGQWERAQRTKFALPYFLYVQTTSAAPRDDHLAQVGTIAHVDDPYWDTWFPPNGWNCKCQVRQVSQMEAEKLGPRPPRPVATRPWMNKRTGVVEDIPVGIDPGWHRNPGKLRHANLDELLSGTLDNVDPALRAATLKDLPNSWLFRKIVSGEVDSTPGKPGFFQLPKTVDVAAPIGHLSSEIATVQGGRSGIVWVSGEKVMIPQWQGITSRQWLHAPRVIDEGAVVRHDRHESNKEWLTIYRTIGNTTYRAEVSLRNALVEGMPYRGGERFNLESYAIVDAHLARADIELARHEGRLARAEAKKGANLLASKPASLGAAATPKGGGEPPRSGDAIPARKLPGDSLSLLPPDEGARQIDAYKSLTAFDQAAIRSYTSDYYLQINRYFRTGEVTEIGRDGSLIAARPEKLERIRSKIEAIAKAVQSAVAKNRLPAGTVLYRGQYIFDQRIMEPGFEWVDRAFVSTTRQLTEGFRFHDDRVKTGMPMTVLVIDAGERMGLGVEKLSKFGYEREFVLPAGTKFRVKSVEQKVRRGFLDKPRTYVHVEIVDQPDELLVPRSKASQRRSSKAIARQRSRARMSEEEQSA